jgi:hypothetical protein
VRCYASGTKVVGSIAHGDASQEPVGGIGLPLIFGVCHGEHNARVQFAGNQVAVDLEQDRSLH